MPTAYTRARTTTHRPLHTVDARHRTRVDHPAADTRRARTDASRASFGARPGTATRAHALRRTRVDARASRHPHARARYRPPRARPLPRRARHPRARAPLHARAWPPARSTARSASTQVSPRRAYAAAHRAAPAPGTGGAQS